jgi:hypothetical protein
LRSARGSRLLSPHGPRPKHEERAGRSRLHMLPEVTVKVQSGASFSS